MASTPTSRKSFNKSLDLSPSILAAYSPGLILSPSRDTNISQRLATILKQIIELYDKWQAAQKRGTTLCHSIESIKRRALDAKDKRGGGDSALYPDELKQPCKTLAVVTTIFEDVVSEMTTFQRQLTALAKLEPGAAAPGDAESPPVYKTWRMSKFLSFVDDVLNAYRQNIAHSSSLAELIWHTSVWQFPVYVNQHMEASFRELKMEIL